MFDTKFVVVVREDLAVWQKLNVTAFLATGVAASKPELIGENYVDASGNIYNPMSVQPVIVLSADSRTLKTIHQRTLNRHVPASLYIEEMFSTGHDKANRDVFAKHAPEDVRIAGIAFHTDKKLADKISKGAKMHP